MRSLKLKACGKTVSELALVSVSICESCMIIGISFRFVKENLVPKLLVFHEQRAIPKVYANSANPKPWLNPKAKIKVPRRFTPTWPLSPATSILSAEKFAKSEPLSP
jgi:hypothetical protein